MGAQPPDRDFRRRERGGRGIALHGLDCLETSPAAVGTARVATVVGLEPVRSHQVEAQPSPIAVYLEVEFVVRPGSQSRGFDCAHGAVLEFDLEESHVVDLDPGHAALGRRALGDERLADGGDGADFAGQVAHEVYDV